MLKGHPHPPATVWLYGRREGQRVVGEEPSVTLEKRTVPSQALTKGHWLLFPSGIIVQKREEGNGEALTGAEEIRASERRHYEQKRV